MEPNSTQSQPVLTTSLPKIEGPITLLENAWSLFVHNWKLLSAIVVVPSVVNLAGSLLLSNDHVVSVVVGIVLIICSIILSFVMAPAIIDSLHRLSSGASVALSVIGQYRLGLRYFWSIIFIVLIMLFIGIGSAILMLVPAIIVCIYTTLYMYVLVVDGKKGFGALTESYSLVRGRWWAVFGRSIFLIAVFAVIGILLAIILSLFGLSEPVGVLDKTVVSVVNIIFTAILAPVAMTYTYRMYASLKSSRTADVQVKIFKRFLVVFASIGVLVLIFLASITPIVISKIVKAIKDNPDSVQEQLTLKLDEIERKLDESEVFPVQNN